MDWVRNVRTRITEDPGLDYQPRWSPAGLRIVFGSWRKGNAELFEKKVDGVSEETILLDSPAYKVTPAWSKDGRYILYTQGKDSDWDIYALPLFGERKPIPIVQSPGTNYNPNLSFDGKWLAYQSDMSGTYQIYVISFPAADQKRQISSEGGMHPQWRKDWKELYYLSLDAKIMAVDIAAGTKIDSGIPRVLFDTNIRVAYDLNQYAPAPDGQRFLLLKPLKETMSTPITIVVNWTSLLRK